MQIQAATAADAPRLTTIFLAAFSDPFSHAMFPRTADVRAWWEAKFRAESMSEGSVLLKVVDSPLVSFSSEGGCLEGEKEGEIVAFALWKLPVHENTHGHDHDKEDTKEEEEEEEAYPPSANQSLCHRFFSGMAAQRAKYMSTRPHYYLDILGTHPAHNGRGIASQLLRWGMGQADAEKLPVFLSASPAGRPMYEKRGFRVLGVEEVAEGYEQAYMIRDRTFNY